MNATSQPAAASVRVQVVEVTIDEALDLSAVPHIGARLDGILAMNPRHVVIDLSRCPRIDAAAIALLLDVHRRLWRVGGHLSLHSVAPRLLRLLQVARVDQVLNIVPPPATEPAPAGVLAPLAADPPDAA